VTKDLFGRLQDELESREEEEEGEKNSTMLDTLTLPAPLQRIIGKIMRRGELSLEQLAAEMKSTPGEVEPLLDTLVEKRFLEVEGSGQQRRYKPYLGRKRARKLPVSIWESLDDKLIR
jgi:DNA-binding MarR family transcriptional regulator